MIRDLGVGISIDIDDGPLAELDRLMNDIARRLSTLDFGNLERLEVDEITDDFSDLEDAVDDVDSSLNDLDRNNLNNLESEASNAESAFGRLKNGIMAVGAAVVAGFAIDKIKDFGLAAVEAAASGQARDAQFSSVFGDLEEGAAASLSKIAETTGMYENRLKGTFSQIAAFAKTTGADTADALALSERATLAAADSAAFYDKSIEESAESLQSFLKGNFENDAALGISATEFTRNAKAAELFGKKFNELTEYQKQDTLLKMVEDGNKLSGALGQAAKESDTWENQIGNLRSAWEGFLEKVGTPILEQVVGVVTILADTLSSVDPGPFMNFLSNAFDKLLVVKDIAMAVYDSIMSLVYDTGEVADIWTALGIPPEIAEGIASFGNTVREAFLYAKDVVMQFVNEVIIPLMPVAQEYVSSAFGYIKNVVDVVTTTFDTLKSAIKGIVENIIIPLMPVAQGVIETAFKIISPILDLAGSLFKTMASIVSFLVQDIIVPLLPLAAAAISGAWNVMKPVLDAIAGAFDKIVSSVQAVIDKIGGAVEALKNFNVGDKISSATNWVKDKVPFLNVGLGRVPYDDMPAVLHKDETVLPKSEADMLRNEGILKGDGTGPTLDFSAMAGLGQVPYDDASTILNKDEAEPTLDFGVASNYNSSTTSTTTTSTTSIQAPVQIIVQGGSTNDETVFNIREAMEEFFADLTATMPQVREG